MTFATFRTNCPDGSHFAQMGSDFAQNINPNPSSLLSRHTPLSGICTYTKHPQPHPKTLLFLAGPALESGQNELPSGASGQPQLSNMFEKWTAFLEVGKKKLFMNIC